MTQVAASADGQRVLSGACDLIAVKDTVAGWHARRVFNAVLGTSTK